jgi:hypothetical protein
MSMHISRMIAASVMAVGLASGALATPFTTTSPTGGALPSGVTKVGGIVVDLKGLNGVRVVSQAAASTLYVGYASSNPQLIGTQTGFTPATIAALGGGIQSASVRVTLFDGDSAPGNFDAGTDNSFFLNGVDFGYWGQQTTEYTSGDGNTVFASAGVGFGDNILSTGFFTNTNAAALSTLFTSLAGGSIAFTLSDVDAGDNYYDFTQGVNGGLINTGTGPVVAPGVPEPATWALMIGGFGLTGLAMRRRKAALVA